MTGAVMRATRCLLDHGITHERGVMPHNERAMTHPVIDVLPAIDIPFVCAIGAFDKDGKRLHAAVIRGDPVRGGGLGAVPKGTGGRERVALSMVRRPGALPRREEATDAHPMAARHARLA